ncbi:U3 small nucleolar RNA-associated protein 18 homolog [Tachyglossus aculeatus]|uniref:U3 small nucleolar RNA-associated protein 18 homolog n=1 Tax=Tachyglossus aculeatus TaxID=9261 RepID=UPI0018F6BB3C|nr:U3 small nucleolar RNA-associated protein 18 homolog [Tachyglossus aculeatus]
MATPAKMRRVQQQRAGEQTSGRPSGWRRKWPSGQPTDGPRKRTNGQPTDGPRKRTSVRPNRWSTDGPRKKPNLQRSDGPRKRPNVGPNMRPNGGPRKGPNGKPNGRRSNGPRTRPNIRPNMRASDGPRKGPNVRPSDGPRKGPNVRPSDGPRKGPNVRASDGPRKGPNMPASDGPRKGPNVRASDGPRKGPNVRASDGPRKRPIVRVSDGPRKGPNVRASDGPRKGPNMRPSDGPRKRPNMRPSDRPRKRPNVRRSDGPRKRPNVRPGDESSEESRRWPNRQFSVRPNPGPPAPKPLSLEAAAAEEARRQQHLLALGRDKPEVERCLEELVFGGDHQEGDEECLLRRLRGSGDDRVVGGKLRKDSSDSEEENEAKDNSLSRRKPVWMDEDDDKEEAIDMTEHRRKALKKSTQEKQLTKKQFQRRLREEFQQAMGGNPAWAEIGRKKRHSEDDSEDEEENLLLRTGNFITTSASLPRGVLEIKKCPDANCQLPSSANLSSVRFHPCAQVVMTASRDTSLTLFQVDGKTNPKIQSISLERFPIYQARFSASGEEVIATSVRSKIIYVYDMIGGSINPVHQVRGLEENFVKKFEVSPDGSFLLLTGTKGYLHLLSMKSKELIGSMKISGKSLASVFSPDSSKVFSTSDTGDVFIWDVGSRKYLHRFTDEGCLSGRCIALSRNGQYVACGSSSGVVNVYTQEACLRDANPKPVRAIMNLVTPATSLAFNPTTEILAIASNEANEGLKMVHLPSCTVFSNFPESNKKGIFLSQSMDFSPRSGFFTLGNNKGRALLYRLQHYADF